MPCFLPGKSRAAVPVGFDRFKAKGFMVVSVYQVKGRITHGVVVVHHVVPFSAKFQHHSFEVFSGLVSSGSATFEP